MQKKTTMQQIIMRDIIFLLYWPCLCHRYSGIGSLLFSWKKNFPVFFFLFGIFVINLCYIIREISLFHIIREISLFPPVYHPAPATININILEGNYLYNNNQTLTKRKAGINPYFYHLSVRINLLFSHERRFSPWI